MVRRWDDPLKGVVIQIPEDFVKWLWPESRFDEELPSQLGSENLDTDLLCRVLYKDQPYLLHIEFQRTGDPDAAQRVAKYNALAAREYDLPVYSVLIYPKNMQDSAEFPSVQISPWDKDAPRSTYRVIKLWEVPTEAILNAGLAGILPLVPFTSQDLDRGAIEQVIAKLSPPGEDIRFELLLLTYQLCVSAYIPRATIEDKDWILGHFSVFGKMLSSMMQPSSVFDTEREAEEERVSQQVTRQNIVAIVKDRFPSLTKVAQEWIDLSQSSRLLRQILILVADAQDEKETRRALLPKGYEQWSSDNKESGITSDIVRETSIYKTWRKEVEEEVMKYNIFAVSIAKFPSLIDLMQKRLEHLKKPEQLQRLLVRIARAKDEEEARAVLLTEGNQPL